MSAWVGGRTMMSFARVWSEEPVEAEIPRSFALLGIDWSILILTPRLTPHPLLRGRFARATGYQPDRFRSYHFYKASFYFSVKDAENFQPTEAARLC
jgi:hypothetical protein